MTGKNQDQGEEQRRCDVRRDGVEKSSQGHSIVGTNRYLLRTVQAETEKDLGGDRCKKHIRLCEELFSVIISGGGMVLSRESFNAQWRSHGLGRQNDRAREQSGSKDNSRVGILEGGGGS